MTKRRLGWLAARFGSLPPTSVAVDVSFGEVAGGRRDPPEASPAVDFGGAEAGGVLGF